MSPVDPLFRRTANRCLEEIRTQYYGGTNIPGYIKCMEEDPLSVALGSTSGVGE